MKYDETTNSATLCITGEEATCKEIFVKTYNAGTIIKYKVNSSTTRTFYVLHDDGDKITLQDRENLVNRIEWCRGCNNNSQGPLTALETLETATSDWTNVDDQTYTMGTTNFNGTNAYTGCNASSGETLSCDRNSNYGYTLASRTAKARMITGQETATLGCKYNINKTCPVWMNNYLSNSTNYGGTNTGIDAGYHTMSAYSSSPSYSWCIIYYGRVIYYTVSGYSYGIRPVIVIEK